MRQTYADEGIVLRKRSLKEGTYAVTLLTKNNGKSTYFIYHTKKVTSKRLAHFETGQYIRFTYTHRNDSNLLDESEILWGYSNIKSSSIKLRYLYQLFMILYKLLPDEQTEPHLFDQVDQHLRMVNKISENDLTTQKLDAFVSSILLYLGYIDKHMYDQKHFEPMSFIENMVGKSVTIKY